MIQDYGADPFRYFLLREFSFGQDGNFSKEQFVQRLNTELANELGNLVSRTTSMVGKYCDGKVPTYSEAEVGTFLRELHPHFSQYQEKLEALKFEQAFSHVWDAIKVANQYIEQQQPWTLAKNGETEILGTTLYNILEVIRMVAIAIAPIMPGMSEQIQAKLGREKIEATPGINKFSAMFEIAVLVPGDGIDKGDALFQRIDI